MKNSKISKKTAIIIICALVLVVIGGVLGAVLGHQAYLGNKKAEIVNYASTSSSDFYMKDSGMLFYKYDAEDTVVKVSEFVEVSEGATLNILNVLTYANGELKTTSNLSGELSVASGERYFVITEVVSMGGDKKNGYVIEVASIDNNDNVFPMIEDLYKDFITIE